ncbi:protein NRT1/ PTR FAMILY 4.3-like [Hordeum vulgare]|nr:protein NRT1/ PTR FAMILY 4.3-like [Hordeum vulgare]
MREATGSGAVGVSSTRAATGLALMAFLVGMPRYLIFTVQGNSALLEIFRVYVAAIRNRNLQLPENPDELYEISRSKAAPEVEFVSHRDRPFRFLDRMAILQALTAETPSPWRQVPGDTRGARQDGVGHGANLLQRHHHGHLPGPVPIPSPSSRAPP